MKKEISNLLDNYSLSKSTNSLGPWTDNRALLVKQLSKNKITADVACGSGDFSILSAQSGAIKCISFDARPLHETFFTKASEYQVAEKIFYHQTDLRDLKQCKHLISEAEVIFYYGHLYHSTNHFETIRTFSETSCRDLVIDSMFQANNDIEQLKYSMIYCEVERTSDWWMAYDTKLPQLFIGMPNLHWVIQALSALGWTPKVVSYGEHTVARTGGKKIRYTVHATR